MPVWRGLLGRWPHSVLRASEEAVGLPPGQMGNSEVGHLNLGAGRPVLQDLPRIDAAIADGSFFERPALLAACGPRGTARRPAPRHQPHRSGRRPRQRPPPRRPRRAGRAARRAGGPGPRPARRPRHAAAVGARRSWRTSRRGWRPPIRTPGSRRSAAATTRWIATSAGSGSARGYDAIVHGVGERAPSATAAIEAGLRARRERRVRRCRRSSTASTAASATATRSSTPTSAPTGRASSPTPWPTATLRRRSIAPRPARARATSSS